MWKVRIYGFCIGLMIGIVLLAVAVFIFNGWAVIRLVRDVIAG